jgi:hypothetical protein
VARHDLGLLVNCKLYFLTDPKQGSAKLLYFRAVSENIGWAQHIWKKQAQRKVPQPYGAR